MLYLARTRRSSKGKAFYLQGQIQRKLPVVHNPGGDTAVRLVLEAADDRLIGPLHIIIARFHRAVELQYRVADARPGVGELPVEVPSAQPLAPAEMLQRVLLEGRLGQLLQRDELFQSVGGAEFVQCRPQLAGNIN